MEKEQQLEEEIERIHKKVTPGRNKIYLLIPKKLTNLEEELIVDTIKFEQAKAELKGRQEAKKELIEDEITFLKPILKSNKDRDDCLIHMVKGRLDKLQEKKQ